MEEINNIEIHVDFILGEEVDPIVNLYELILYNYDETTFQQNLRFSVPTEEEKLKACILYLYCVYEEDIPIDLVSSLSLRKIIGKEKFKILSDFCKPLETCKASQHRANYYTLINNVKLYYYDNKGKKFDIHIKIT